ncbi:DedA family protein [Sphingobium cloacae]|uniref:VTT domain-containing protein n=1 Tax=Sphingobium cloacae TaxID=120107 RepID=A0A1E1EZM7_9SPHN|nr:DedA family protein [Sphingobium cloacae]BAV63728.1 hypothetical protein SCLO_1006880 [Sphingobium cloacae]
MTSIDEWIAGLLALITDNAALAGPVIGLLAFAESMIVIGMFVPAIALMMAMGGLIAAGFLDPLPVLFWAIVGSILGDWISYLLGRWIGPSAYRRWPLRHHRAAVARTRLFFRRYGFVSVFLGRFFGPVRATIPLVAGVMQMPGRSFQMANISSAVIWVPALLAPGYLAGASLPAEMLDGRLILGMVGILLFVPFLFAAIVGRLMLRRRSTGRRPPQVRSRPR